MLNTAVVERHGLSPLFFLFGCQPRLPASPANSLEVLDPAALNFVLSFKTSLQEALDVDRLAQSHLIEKMDKRQDPGHELAVGNWPYVDTEITPIPGNPHFRVKYSGPFFAKAVITSTATLDIPEHWQISTNTFNADKLKKHVVRGEIHFCSAHVVLLAGWLLIKGSLRWRPIIAAWVGVERTDSRTSSSPFIGKGCLAPNIIS